MRMKRLALVLLLTAGVVGCNSFSYVSRTYVSLTPQVVTIGCNEPYEVYDNRQKRKMLIVSNALREVTGCDIGTAAAAQDPVATRPARFRTAARAYLDETVREDCTLAGETVFSDLQTEFAYTCAGPIEPRGTPVPRLPGRPRDVHHR